MLNDIEKLVKLNEELGDEKFDEVMKRVANAEKKIKNRYVLKNSMSEDFAKGSMRNHKCPVCEKKMKRCICNFKKNYK